jgi:hypothetical protein
VQHHVPGRIKSPRKSAGGEGVRITSPRRSTGPEKVSKVGGLPRPSSSERGESGGKFGGGEHAGEGQSSSEVRAKTPFSPRHSTDDSRTASRAKSVDEPIPTPLSPGRIRSPRKSLGAESHPELLPAISTPAESSGAGGKSPARASSPVKRGLRSPARAPSPVKKVVSPVVKSIRPRFTKVRPNLAAAAVKR